VIDSSWGLLPMEILEKIFGFLPKLLLKSVGLVCYQWGNTVHRCAVKHLTRCIETGQIEEKHLENLAGKQVLLGIMIMPHVLAFILPLVSSPGKAQS
jgi:hypothetical protein